MDSTKVAVTLDKALLKRVDRLVRREVYPSRSQAIRAAVAEKLASLEERAPADEWDLQIEEDAKSGRLDRPARKALAEHRRG